MTQEKLETMVLNSFLSYGDEISDRLKNQIGHLVVKKRDYTGVGFFTYYTAPLELRVDQVSKTYYDVSVKYKDAQDWLNFILYIEDGYIDCLEAYTTAEQWYEGEFDVLDLSVIEGGGKSAFA